MRKKKLTKKCIETSFKHSAGVSSTDDKRKKRQKQAPVMHRKWVEGTFVVSRLLNSYLNVQDLSKHLFNDCQKFRVHSFSPRPSSIIDSLRSLSREKYTALSIANFEKKRTTELKGQDLITTKKSRFTSVKK